MFACLCFAEGTMKGKEGGLLVCAHALIDCAIVPIFQGKSKGRRHMRDLQQPKFLFLPGLYAC